IRAEDLRKLSTKEKVPYVLRIHDELVLSGPLCASLVEVKESLYTWPQLASSVALGGAVVTDVARRILLGRLTSSGRFSIDLEQLSGPRGAVEIREPRPIGAPVTDEAARPRELELPLPACGPLSGAEVRFLVRCATLAPSAGNSQPWSFRYKEGTLEALVD